MAHEEHTGAMIALIPTSAEAARLAVPGGEAPEDLHVTLWYSDEGATLPTEFQDRMHQVGQALTGMLPLTADAFSVDLFNPGTDSACVVLGIGGTAVSNAHKAVVGRIGDGDTKQPWVAHLTLKYLNDSGIDLDQYLERIGPVVFDRVRVAIGEDFIDHGIQEPEEVNMEATVKIDDRDSEYASADCGCPEGVDEVLASVNTNTWSSLPIADRETPWDADDAIARISTWAGGNGNKFGSPFLWKAKDGQPLNPDSYRLPIADVVNGKLTMIPRAVFEAGKILSGAHGALEGVVTEPEREALKSTVTEMYNKLQELYQDPRVVAPWLRGRTKSERAAEEKEMNVSSSIVYVGEPPPEETEPITAAGILAPPREWFNEPRMDSPELFTVTADGEVRGLLAQWNVCHAGVMNKCLLAPKSITNYRYFRNGHVLTADGSLVRVGRLTVGTGHADRMQGLIAAAEHYDNSGTAVAVVACGENQFGIWVHGAVVAGASPEKVAELRRSPLSGDWRRSPEGNLELVAALAVNTPGFPILYEADGEVASLLAAGMMIPEGMALEQDVDHIKRRTHQIDGMDEMLTKHFEKQRRDRVLHIFGG